MEEYTPRYIIGVPHADECIDTTCELLDSLIFASRRRDLRVVGIEPCSFPVDPALYYPEFERFFRTVGEFVQDECGGQVVPLSSREADEHILRISERTHAAMKRLRKERPEVIRGNSEMFDVIWKRYSTWDRYKLGYRELGRDIAMIENARRFQPQVVVTGPGHSGPFCYEFPDAELRIIS